MDGWRDEYRNLKLGAFRQHNNLDRPYSLVQFWPQNTMIGPVQNTKQRPQKTIVSPIEKASNHYCPKAI